MKKSQISQVFIYLMAIVVIGLLVFVGYKGIAWIMNSQCRQSDAAFERNLLDFIDEYSDRSSVREEILSTPCDASQVCFVDSSYCPRDDSLFSGIDFGQDMVIASSADDCTANIFVKGKDTKPLKYQDKLALSGEPFQCFDVRQGKIKLLFSGTGRKTIVSTTAISELPFPTAETGGTPDADGGAGGPAGPVTPDVSPSEGTVYLYPATMTVATGGLVALEIRASNMANLYGFQATVQYDPVVLEFADFQQNYWMSNNGAIPVYCDYILESGKVKDLFCTRFGLVSGVSGNGILGKVIFRAKAPGQSTIILSDVLGSNPSSEGISVSTVNGQVVVI